MTASLKVQAYDSLAKIEMLQHQINNSHQMLELNAERENLARLNQLIYQQNEIDAAKVAEKQVKQTVEKARNKKKGK